ncbi:GNAT family N-acetyltransferase [Methylobacterium oryzae CBMB20]
MSDTLRDNVEQSRFELQVGGDVAFATYRREPGHLVISYVYAPPVLRGTGAAARLMEGVAARARAEGTGLCPCAAMPGPGCAGTGRIAICSRETATSAAAPLRGG